MATREGGSEWEPKKFFGKNSAYDPKSNPRILHTNSSNHQDHVVTTNLPILRMILERWEEVVESKTKTRDEERKQNGQLRVQPGHPDIEGGSPASQQTQTGSPGHRGAGHPPPNSTTTGHPDQRGRVTLRTQKSHPRDKLKLPIDGSPKPSNGLT